MSRVNQMINWGDHLDKTCEIAVVCPSRDRPKALKKCIESMLSTSTKAAFICYIDEDQIQEYAKLDLWGPRVAMHVGSRIGPVNAANTLCHLYRKPLRIYGMVPDDCWFETKGWDDFAIQTIDSFPNRIGLLSAAHNGGNYVNFPWVSREWIDTVGWLYYPHNFHHCCDSIIELLGDCTHLHEARPEDFSMHHELVTTLNRDKFAADCLNFLTWCIGERRDIVRKLRERM